MRSHAGLALAIALGVLVRVPFWSEALRTPVDGDTAIIGLMARHPLQGATMWGQPYGSPVEAWLAAPFVAALGPRGDALRFFYFLMGLALIPVAYGVGAALHPRAALPAAVLMACPPPYFLLLSALPPPLYPTTLVLCGLLPILAVRIGARLAAGERPRETLFLWGLLAGLALWTHLMSGSVIAACGGFLFGRARGRRFLLVIALAGLLGASSPWWLMTLQDRWAARIVSVSDREQTMGEHVAAVIPVLHRPLAGLLGLHTPVVADDATHVVSAAGWVGTGLIVVYGALLILAARSARAGGSAALLLAAAALALAAFPFPLRSGPDAIRFLTPLGLPVLALVAWAPLAASGREESGVRRAWIVALSLACLHLFGGARLLAAWRGLDRAAAPFLVPDLSPVRRMLEQHKIRRVYASYGPAYRLSFESGETIIASQPWNERFRHYSLPYLDEVRFSKNVAWVLTPGIPTDLPSPKAFEDALGAMGGSFKRSEAGAAVIYHGFTPPFGSTVDLLSGDHPVSDGKLASGVFPPPDKPLTLALRTPRALDGLTLVTGLGSLGLPRSVDVEVSADGIRFEIVARRRRRGERDDLRWVNGQPQYVLDHDLLAIPLGGRTVAALRISPYASTEVWALAEVLLHPAEDPARRVPWDEWLDPSLTWDGRRRALAANPRREREDWYYRVLLAERHR